MFRRVLLGLLVLLAIVLVALDRVGAWVAAGQVADRIRTEESLASRPAVTIGGFPFLTQALRGRYRDIHVVASNVRRGRLRVAEVDAHLRGARLSLSQAVQGTVSAVPVDSVDAVVLVRYTDLTSALPGSALTVSGDGNGVRVRGSVQLFGQQVSGSALGTVRVAPDTVTIVPHDIRLGSSTTNITLPPEVISALTFTLPVSLPFGLALRSATPGVDGLRLRATGGSLVLRR